MAAAAARLIRRGRERVVCWVVSVTTGSFCSDGWTPPGSGRGHDVLPGDGEQVTNGPRVGAATPGSRWVGCLGGGCQALFLSPCVAEVVSRKPLAGHHRSADLTTGRQPLVLVLCWPRSVIATQSRSSGGYGAM